MQHQHLNDRFARVFAAGSGPLLFVAGWLVLGLLGSAIYDLLKDWLGNTVWVHALVAVVALLIVAGIYVWLRALLRQAQGPVRSRAKTVLLNFAHPLTEEQLTQVVAMLREMPDVRNITVQVDRQRSLAEVVVALANAAQLEPAEWQALPLVVNPPGLAPVALALMAELHGRCGYFPAMLNIRPLTGTNPPQYEVANVTNLQELRDLARTRR